MLFEKVAIIGVGLIGGSFALGLKEKKLVRQIVGAGRSAANLRLALERGVIDASTADAASAAQGADLVMISTPVSQFERIFGEIGNNLKPGALVLDAGSTKRDVVAAARKSLGGKVAQFVPSHPIAGAEHSGAGAATAGLFRSRRVVLTPLKENREEDIQTISVLWSELGARVSRMTPEQHDEVFAAVSHLPHLLAYALVSDVSARANAAQLFGYAAGGFRDFTRIASSHPEMWRDICVANSDELLKEVAHFSGQVEKIKKLLEKKDSNAIEKVFSDARAARERWLNGEYE
jgi:prephenate dehydrogenase